MKRKLFIACTALIVSAAAVVGVKAYNYYSMPALMRANLDALSQGELPKSTLKGYCEMIIPYFNCYYVCECGKEWYDSRYGKAGKLVDITGKCSCKRDGKLK